MILRPSFLALLAAPVLGLLAGCQPPPRPIAGASRTDAAAAAYCRQRAQEIYETQNRGAQLRIDQRDSPFSGAYLPNSETRDLADRYAVDAMIADCIRNSANRGQSTDPINAPQPAVAGQPGSRSATPAELRPAAPAGERAAKPLDRAPPPPPPVR